MKKIIGKSPSSSMDSTSVVVPCSPMNGFLLLPVSDSIFPTNFPMSNFETLQPSDCADNAGFFEIFLGSHNVRLTSEPTRVEVTATEYIVHENWGPVRIVNDIALIKLPSPITFTRKIINGQRLQ